jgi:hypothetical protein
MCADFDGGENAPPKLKDGVFPLPRPWSAYDALVSFEKAGAPAGGAAPTEFTSPKR